MQNSDWGWNMGLSLWAWAKMKINGMALLNLTSNQEVQSSKVGREDHGICVLGFQRGNPCWFYANWNRNKLGAESLKKLKGRIRRVRPELEMSKVLLQHDNTRPHTRIRTREVISSFGWSAITHPPCSPDLAPSDYHLFGQHQERLLLRWWSSERCRAELAESTTGQVLRHCDTRTCSQVDYSSGKRRPCWEMDLESSHVRHKFDAYIVHVLWIHHW